MLSQFKKHCKGLFKPTLIKDFIWEEEDREWDPTRLIEMRNRASQSELFAEEAWRETFRVIPKQPFSFSYRFEDDAGKASELQVLDWEAGALYWNCVRKAGGDDVPQRGGSRGENHGLKRGLGKRARERFCGPDQPSAKREFPGTAARPPLCTGQAGLTSADAANSKEIENRVAILDIPPRGYLPPCVASMQFRHVLATQFRVLR